MSEVSTPPESVSPFPPPASVFATDIDLHRRHFLPLLSIEASRIDPTWKGQLHVVSVKETYDGAVGEYCREFHNDLCKDNQVAFKVDADGRYSFLADFRFFVSERGAKSGTHASQRLVDEFVVHYAETQNSYDAIKAFYHRTGGLNPNFERQPERRDPWLSFEPLGYAPTPQFTDGRSPRFVARARGWSYYKNGPDWASLYFEPIERIAVIRFDFD